MGLDAPHAPQLWRRAEFHMHDAPAAELVRISPSGDVMLGSGGVRDATTLASLNDALNLIGIRVTAPGGATSGADWSISDGRSLTRFFDGVVSGAARVERATCGAAGGCGWRRLEACWEWCLGLGRATGAASTAPAPLDGLALQWVMRHVACGRVVPGGGVVVRQPSQPSKHLCADLGPEGLELCGMRTCKQVTHPRASALLALWLQMLPAKGPQHAARGRQMLLAFKAPNRGLAAAATAASNAAATAAGILPPTGHRPRGSFPAPGQPVADEQQQQQQEEEQRNGGGVFSRLGATAAVDDDRTRRLRAQGRYLPY